MLSSFAEYRSSIRASAEFIFPLSFRSPNIAQAEIAVTLTAIAAAAATLMIFFMVLFIFFPSFIFGVFSVYPVL